jgi:hypothetical protein
MPPKRGRFTITLPGLGDALPDFGMAVVFLITWIAPHTFGERAVAWLMLTMLIEFINVHSSAFIGQIIIGKAVPAEKLKGLVVVGSFYTLFIAGFALAFKTWWPVVSFWAQTLNRSMGAMLGQAPSGLEKKYLQAAWASAVLFYVVFVGVTTVLPIPPLGITRPVVHALHLPGSGEWISHPQKVIAFGFLYFLATAISELFGHRWMINAPDANARPTERAAA